MARSNGPWWDDPLIVIPVCLVVLFFVMFGPTMCEAFGVKQ